MTSDIREQAARAAEKRAKMMQEEAGGREVAYSLSDYSDGYLAGYEAAKAEGGELPGAEVVRGLHWRVS